MAAQALQGRVHMQGLVVRANGGSEAQVSERVEAAGMPTSISGALPRA